jgi:molybdopterin-guanine dinucleotide biosynthesis protein A
MAEGLDSPGYENGMASHKQSLRETPIRGLVLAGGRSARMRRDKGLLAYHCMPQVLWVRGLLSDFCEDVYVSINPEQCAIQPYDDLPTLVDQEADRGPAAGLLSAWEALPGSAWLVVAVDLPFVDTDTLAALVAGRAPDVLATAFRHPDGVFEPVCTLWEPAARPGLSDCLASGDGSLRRVLEEGPTKELAPPAPGVLMSVNTPGEYRAALTKIELGEGA